jgi:oxygen-dependent protoporphyrinogen oxidase
VSQRSTVVVGAGLSGLACAFDLARAGRAVVVLEASERAGGVVGGIERDGFRFETGPNTIQASSAAFRTLCGDLGIADRLIVSPPEQKDRFVFVHGAMRALPATPLQFLTTPVLSLRSRAFVCTEAFRAWRPPSGDVEPDLESFLTERLGAEAARVLGGAFVRGIYAAELAELGAKSAMPRMWRALEEHKSLVRGLRALGKRPQLDLPGPRVPRTSLLSFPDGLREIVAALERALGEHGATLRMPCAARNVHRTKGSGAGRSRWRVEMTSGDPIEADELVLAVPAPVAARLLDGAGTRDLPLQSLRGIAHARVTLVHLGFEQSELSLFPAGFGYLVPPSVAAMRMQADAHENASTAASNRSRATSSRPRASAASSDEPLALGTIFTSNLFPGRAPRGCIAVTSFYKSDDVERMNEKDLISRACGDLALALCAESRPRPRVAITQRWSDVIPHYAPGHADRMCDLLQRIASDHAGLHLAGSYVAGVSVEDVIARGRAVTAEILAADPAHGELARESARRDASVPSHDHARGESA